MTKYAVIFDCDGTLVDSLGQALESFNYALEKMGEAPREPEAIKKYFGAGADRIFTQLLGDEKKGLAAFEHYVDHQSELCKGMRLHDGVRELLENLKELNVPMGVVTGRHARDMEVVLAPHKISDYFGVFIADSHLPYSKPAPDGILMAAAKLGIPPEQTFYVGDSKTDIQAAHHAGGFSVAALWDQLVKIDEMEKEKPTIMAKRPADVLAGFLRHADLKSCR